eukprot:scaffold47288_cov25-Tisochrysis_lutea.AAC.1
MPVQPDTSGNVCPSNLGLDEQWIKPGALSAGTMRTSPTHAWVSTQTRFFRHSACAITLPPIFAGFGNSSFAPHARSPKSSPLPLPPCSG